MEHHKDRPGKKYQEKARLPLTEESMIRYVHILTSQDKHVALINREGVQLLGGRGKIQVPVIVKDSRVFFSFNTKGEVVKVNGRSTEADTLCFVLTGAIIFNGERLASGEWIFLPRGSSCSFTVGEDGAMISHIKTYFDFNEAELGTILLFMPFSSMVGLPISGWLVSRYDSRVPMAAAFVALSLSLAFIGFAKTEVLLIVSLCFFSFSMRMVNISVNTQALHLQKQFDRNINGSFHGLWSTGGIVGVAFSTLLVALHVNIETHFSIIALITLGATFFCYRFLLHNDRAPAGNKLTLAKPDPYIVYLGLLVFFAAICEGGMFDWSGIFFREVVKEEIFTLGYLNFMVFMALSRFASDRIVERIGMPRTFILSASFILSGILVAVIFPTFWPSMIGFCLVGFGTASVIPMTYFLAGDSQKYSPGMAISIIATYGIAGAFLGPPLIGYIAHALSLKIAFLTFALAGVMLVPISQMFFKHKHARS